ncbi:hypothetical protein VXJ24_03400 [Olsenella sp. YH-ols2221]|uniref:hypothetical protein n=1 Tax=Olsenella kribbiana TaxID=3115221 RepID=UPI002ED88BF3
MLQHLAPKDFEPETITLDGRTLRYRSCRGVRYCERPQDPIQVLNIFVPEAYFEGGSISGYTAETAPSSARARSAATCQDQLQSQDPTTSSRRTPSSRPLRMAT